MADIFLVYLFACAIVWTAVCMLVWLESDGAEDVSSGWLFGLLFCWVVIPGYGLALLWRRWRV